MLRDGVYDKKIACIQAKRLYKKLLKLHEMTEKDAVTPRELIREELESFTDSFDFFIDIIHLMDAQDDDIKVIDCFKKKEEK